MGLLGSGESLSIRNTEADIEPKYPPVLISILILESPTVESCTFHHLLSNTFMCSNSFNSLCVIILCLLVCGTDPQ